MMHHAFDNMTEPELRQMFNEIGTLVDHLTPEKTGFIVIAAPMGEGGVTQYVSNVRKEDAQTLLREMLARWEVDDEVER